MIAKTINRKNYFYFDGAQKKNINWVPNWNFRSNIFLDVASQWRLSSCCDNIWLTWDCKTDAILSICFSFELLFRIQLHLKCSILYISGWFGIFRISKNLENRGKSIKMDGKSQKWTRNLFSLVLLCQAISFESAISSTSHVLSLLVLYLFWNVIWKVT